MKVERINNNQIRFIFMAQDLAERGININDILTRSPNKTQGLFQEITTLLSEEYEFSSAGVPLMFEATMMRDTLSVLVTKMAQGDGAGFGAGGEINQGFAGMVNDVMAQISGQQHFQPYADTNIYPPNPVKPPPNQKNVRQVPPPKIDYVSFAFPNIDDMATAAARIDDTYKGRSHVYKMDGKYHLLLQNIGRDDYSTKKIEKLLHEFGQKQPLSPLSYSIMQEHGEVVIAENAIGSLKKYYGS